MSEVSSAAVHVKDAVKSYQSGPGNARGLDGFSIDVAPGELCAIVGVSGSGKSTLLSVVGGITPVDAGDVIVAGIDVRGLSGEGVLRFRREAVSMIFQEYNLLSMLTARENVSLVGELVSVPDEQLGEEVERTLDEMGLADLMDRYPSELSGGQRQRVAIAQAIVGQRCAGKSVLLADEPTGALDLATTGEVMRAFRAAADAGIAVLVSTHDPAVTAVADRVVTIRDGKNVATYPSEVGK